MKLIDSSIRYPVSTAVAVLLLVLFGAISLSRIPVQLMPNIEEPRVTVRTFWPGASPHEIEREIVQEQEEQLKSLEGLVKMESSCQDSVGTITLTFQVGTELDTALLRVSNLLQQVERYPENVQKPVIRSVDVRAGAIAWFGLAPTKNGFSGDMSTLLDFAEDYLKPAFERVPGVATEEIVFACLALYRDPVQTVRRIRNNEIAQPIGNPVQIAFLHRPQTLPSGRTHRKASKCPRHDAERQR